MATIEFNNEQKALMVKKVKLYFSEELDQDIGGFDAEFLIDFFAKEMGGFYYNKGLQDAQEIIVSQDGEVSVRLQGQADNAVVGQINTVNFVNPTGLEPVGQNLYVETAVSGAPQEGVPSLEGFGMLVQGALETSNVNTTEELVNLIESQRVYEMNSKVISAVDQMLSYINQQL